MKIYLKPSVYVSIKEKKNHEVTLCVKAIGTESQNREFKICEPQTQCELG